MCAIDCLCVNYCLAEYISRKVHTEPGLKKLPGTTTGFSDTTFRCYAVGQVAENNPRQYDAQQALTKHYKPGHSPQQKIIISQEDTVCSHLPCSGARAEVSPLTAWLQPGDTLASL